MKTYSSISLQKEIRYLNVCVVINWFLKKSLNILLTVFKKATKLRKLYFLPKIHKRLSALPGRPVVFNYGTPTEKVSEYLDYILKPIMQDSSSYIKTSADFLEKTKNIGKIPERERELPQLQRMLSDFILVYLMRLA